MSQTFKIGISLADGNKWHIKSKSVSTMGWVNEMGRIMELQKSVFHARTHLKYPGCNDLKARAPAILFKNKNYPRIFPGDVNNHILDFRWFRFYEDLHTKNMACEFRSPVSDVITLYFSQWMTTRFIFSQSVFKGGLPFHAALCEFNGKGVLIAAPGDTGKSTCAKWLSGQKGWVSLCDDEALVALTQIGEYRVHPFPTWSHYFMNFPVKNYITWDVQKSVPLCAVFFLEQSKKNVVIPLGKGKAAMKMNESAMQVYARFFKNLNDKSKRLLRSKIFDNCCEFAKKIPAYSLYATLDGKFREEIEKVIS